MTSYAMADDCHTGYAATVDAAKDDVCVVTDVSYDRGARRIATSMGDCVEAVVVAVE